MTNNKTSILTSLCATALGVCSVAIASAALPQPYDQKTLAQVEELYGISEDAAVTRLAKEYEAAVQARRIDERNLKGYAGGWFDSGIQGLVVGTNQPADFAAIERVGATPTLVAHSWADLETKRLDVINQLESKIGHNAIRESSIDVRTNTVVLGVRDYALPQASSVLGALHTSVPIRLVPVIPASESGFSSDLHAADPTRNSSWSPGSDGKLSPCSVGASAEKVVGTTYTPGFATAGHCGNTNNRFVADDGTTYLGDVMQSTYVDLYTQEQYFEDGAWVKTVSPFVPKPQVNGYTDGILNVSGTWSGMLIAPVGATVCRYGSASRGPYCGTITAIGADYNATPYILLHGMIKVHGTCTVDGDSGGPLIMPANQVQGTTTGSDNLHSCSVNHSTFDVYFQPVATTLARAKLALGSNAVAMLTPHGRIAPTLNSFRCPDPSNSGTSNGSHIFTCNFIDYDSQGQTTVSWTTSTGLSSNTEEVSGTCPVPGPMVNVVLAVTNPYGTTRKNLSFACPTNPLP